MKTLEIIFLIFLTSCNLIDPPTHVTEELQPFYDRVIYEGNIRGVRVRDIKVILRDLGESINGRYEPLPPWDRKIIIDTEFFLDKKDNNSQAVLRTMAHEIGHHIGRDKHKNGYRDECSPISLMCDGCCIEDLEEDSEYYFDELFGVNLNP